MPYITQEKRDRLDPIIEQLVQELIDLELDDETDNTEGNLNYFVTRTLLMVYGGRDSTRYANVNDAVGMLECIKQEYYRKVAGPYEDQKEFENGAVRRFSHEPEVVGAVEITPDDVRVED